MNSVCPAKIPDAENARGPKLSRPLRSGQGTQLFGWNVQIDLQPCFRHTQSQGSQPDSRQTARLAADQAGKRIDRYLKPSPRGPRLAGYAPGTVLCAILHVFQSLL